MTTDLKDLFPGIKGLDEKSINALLSAIKKNYQNGQFDYLKFKQSVASLVKLDMTDEMAIKSAFTTAATLGLTKDSLLASANKYVYVMEDEREIFAQAVLSQQKSQINDRKSEVKELVQKIEQHNLRIKEIEREISIFQNRIDSVDHDVEQARIKIDQTKMKFLKAYDTINSDIESDIERINKYL